MKKIFSHHLLGAILLISGTAIGAGMLALPTVTAFGGFFPSTLLFICTWLVMLFTAFFFLDVNLSFQEETNLVSMAQKTLGTWGKVVCWVVYLLLLYSLTASYIAGCTPLLVQAIQVATGFAVPKWFAPFLLPLIFGGFIYSGTKGVDLINRLFMIGLVVSFLMLVFYVPGQVHEDKLLHTDFSATLVAIPIVVTAFGYHIIIPTLTSYMKRDRRQLSKAIIVGSIIPIVVYLVWQILVLGTVPIPLLSQAYLSNATAAQPLAQVLHNSFIRLAAQFFSFFAIITSFIGVTLSLSDFLTDGLKIKKSAKGRLGAIILTFLPPLLFVYTYQRGFYAALQYGGVFVAILLIFLPAAMAWKLPKYKKPAYRLLLIVVILVAFGIVLFDFLEETGQLKHLISQYLNV